VLRSPWLLTPPALAKFFLLEHWFGLWLVRLVGLLRFCGLVGWLTGVGWVLQGNWLADEGKVWCMMGMHGGEISLKVCLSLALLLSINLHTNSVDCGESNSALCHLLSQQ
jgi:hypothetical protein